MTDAHIRDGRERGVFNKYMTRFATQTRPFTGRARTVADVLCQLLAHRAGFGLFVATLHIMQHAFKRMTAHGSITAVVHVFEFNRLFTGTKENDLLHAGAQAAPRGIDVKFVMLRQRAQHLEIVKVTAIPAADRTARQRQLRVLQHAIGIEILLHAQPVTGWTRARRVIKREQARFKLAHAVAANRAGKVGGEEQFFRFGIVHIGDDGRAAGEIQRRFKRFGQPLREIVTYLKAVDHHLDSMFLLQLQRGRVREIADFAVNPGADIPLAGEVFQRLSVFALTLFDDGREQHQPLFLRL